ncbi:MAG TPA: STAS domain-containing protein [bacterium]|nr:STAS domain-containing protein [bacterium]
MTPWAQVRHRTDDGVPIVALEGEVDLANVPELQNKILQHVPNTAVGLVLDLSGATYMDSSGVHLLVELADRLRSRRQRLAVVAAAASFVRRVIELSQIPTIITVEADVEPALAHVRGPKTRP